MSTRRNRINQARRISQPSPADQLTAVKAKFTRLRAIRTQLASLKALYREHDQLVAELLPLFIIKTDAQFIVQRQITLGDTTHRLVPYFYDETKGLLKAKQWKSTAMETFTID